MKNDKSVESCLWHNLWIKRIGPGKVKIVDLDDCLADYYGEESIRASFLDLEKTTIRELIQRPVVMKNE